MIRLFARCRGPFPKREPGSSPVAGSELAEMLSAALAAEGLPVSATTESEYDCTFTCELSQRKYPLAVSLDFEDGWWEIVVKPSLKWHARLQGRDENAELGLLVQVIDRALRAEARISDIRWYAKAFGSAESGYASSPTAPLDSATPFWALTPLQRFERGARFVEWAVPALFVAAMLLSLSPKTRPLAGRLFVGAGSLFLGALGAGMLVGCYLRLGSWPRPRRWGDIGLFALWVACGLASTTVAVWVLVTALR